MTEQPRAQIYLAEQRGQLQTDAVQRRLTFNFGSYSAEGREPFGPLLLLNDETLLAGASLSMRVEQPAMVILLPIVGGLEYSRNEVTGFLEPGQAGVLSLAAGTTYSLRNPYDTEVINCLQIWLENPAIDASPALSQQAFDLSTPDTLLPFLNETSNNTNQSDRFWGFIGRYEGRQEGTYALQSAGSGQSRRVFVFVLQGVFEVANRLLHERDGLALTYTSAGEVEFEALSNDALLILIDLGGSKL